MGLPTREEQIKRLVEHTVDNIDFYDLLIYFENKQYDYFESISQEDLTRSYVECFGEEKE